MIRENHHFCFTIKIFTANFSDLYNPLIMILIIFRFIVQPENTWAKVWWDLKVKEWRLCNESKPVLSKGKNKKTHNMFIAWQKHSLDAASQTCRLTTDYTVVLM